MGVLSSAKAQTGQTEAISAEEQLLGSADEESRAQELLPFTRSFGASGTVSGSLAQSAATAGVPPAAMLDAVRAFADAAGPGLQDGDTFYVRWEQTFAYTGEAIGIGRVQWAELKTQSGATFAIHRFQPHEGSAAFFTTGGSAATPPSIAMPLDNLIVSSPFGLRGNPFASGAAMGPVPQSLPMPPSSEHQWRSPRAAQIAALEAGRQARRMFAGFGPRLMPQVFMHEGVDFAVPVGTPVYAAADGVVQAVGPYAGYGNYVRIAHTDGIDTAYGHLSRFAPGLKPGVAVVRGQLIAFSGSTGRSTGPHLHFEVRTDSKPVDPLTHAAVAQLSGPDLDRFTRLVSTEQRERESDDAVARASDF
jgi:murein DD-endopeptidase MepM/ murein hydrolase activator NlpD